MKTVALVIPVFNEEGNVHALCQRLAAVTAGLTDYAWHWLFVDDGSRDATVAKLQQWQQTGRSITILRLTRNFGHQAAIKAGLDYADADAVITMDADLQHPPELIPRLLEQWEQGFQVVQAVRIQDTAASTARRVLIPWAYRVINWFAERPIPPQGADFRLIDGRVLTAVKALPEVNPTLRGMVAWVGFRQTTVDYQVQTRLEGESRFTLRQFVGLLAGGIFDFSRKPLGLATWAAIGLAGIGLLAWAAGLMSGLVFFVFVLAAIELGALSLIGTYLGRAYNQILDRPLYIVSETVNFNPPTDIPS